MIRPVTAQDKETYLRLTDHFYHSDAVLHPVPEAYRLATWEELMRGNTYLECFFDEADGDVRGFLLLAYTFSQESGGKVAWIEEIFVEPEYRGQGIGHDFFRFLREQIEPTCTRLRLEVEPDNDRAKKLYREMGFRDLPYAQMCKGR